MVPLCLKLPTSEGCEGYKLLPPGCLQMLPRSPCMHTHTYTYNSGMEVLGLQVQYACPGVGYWSQPCTGWVGKGHMFSA